MKTVITGATGFLGLNISNALAQKGHEVYAVSREGSENFQKLKKSDLIHPVFYNLGDDVTSLINDVKNADCFIHLAWAGTKGGGRSDHDLHFLNAENSMRLVEAAHHLNCKRFIFAGSQAEYGIHHEMINEDSECRPVSEYGKAKLFFGKNAQAKCREYGIDFVHTRIFSTYGVGDHEHTLVSSCVKTFLANGVMEMSECKNTWNFINIDDLSTLFVKLCEYKEMLCEKGCIYNVAGSDTRMLRDFVDEIYDLCGKKGRCVFGERPQKPEGIVFLDPDITKAYRVLQWSPQVNFAYGILKIIDSYKNQC